ncbi:MAG: purine-binding chemotaxis protein CheW [Firmicutes bacterium]|nr:purine-binding chemotaxis protein CheW [Bacillota bacterium]
MSAASNESEVRLVVFRLADEDYALPIEGVHSVERIMPTTRVPRAPHFVDGVINLRGEVVPVINLRRRLGLPAIENNEDMHIVIALAQEQLVGLLVDEISHVLSLPKTAIQPAEQVIGETNRNFLRGVGKWEDSLVVLLDLERVVDPEM